MYSCIQYIHHIISKLFSLRTCVHTYMYITKLLKRVYRVSFGNSIFEYGTHKIFVIKGMIALDFSLFSVITLQYFNHERI